MSYTVGLDFGTHQTKVCIEDASNPAQKMYEFLEFENPYGDNSVLFPSIVQINQDDTLSYGFPDSAKCKVEIIKEVKIPDIQLPEEPTYQLPDEPVMPELPEKPSFENYKKLSWKEQLKNLVQNKPNEKKTSIRKWEKECKEIKDSYDSEHKAWKNEINDLMDKFQALHLEWIKQCDKVREEHAAYAKKLLQGTQKRLNFRYFKLASFSDVEWKNSIAPEILSVWYIANLIFLLQEKLGEEIFIQFGVPSGSKKAIFDSQKRKAYGILIAAYKLVEKYENRSSFLKLKYTELLEKTVIDYHFSEEELLIYGLNVVPEAFAGLSSITQQKRVQSGMSLLVDIGGGTTDVALFTLDGLQPDIHSVLSFPKGLNFIFERYMALNPEKDLEDIQQLFFDSKGDHSLFNSSIQQYHKDLKHSVTNTIDKIFASFRFRKDIHKLPIENLRDALKNRPIIYCGGGSMYENMRTKVSDFSDINIINKNLLNIPYLVNSNIEEELFTILSTSYGLSIPLEEEIKLTGIEDVFNSIVGDNADKERYKFEHGLTDY